MKEIKNLEASKKLSDKELELVNGGGDSSDNATLEKGDLNKKPGAGSDGIIWTD